VLKYEYFIIINVVAAYHVFVYVVSRAERYVESTYLPARETTKTNTGYAATTFIIMKYSYF